MNQLNFPRVFLSVGLVLLLNACAPAVTATPQASAPPPTTQAELTSEVLELTSEATEPPTDEPTESAPPQAVSADALYVRVNQVGYLPAETKLALALTNVDLSGESFEVIADSMSVFTGEIGIDRGAYGNFAHLYELDFSEVTQPGSYTVTVKGVQSPPVGVGNDVYDALIPLTLEFFKYNRCGDDAEALHAACHLTDGWASGGPLDGEQVDATGGWHDAGDYIKFMITTGYVTNLMLTAYERNPQAFEYQSTANGLPPVLDEAKVGLDWMLKMWHPENDTLYYQVSDWGEYDFWRLPEEDDRQRTLYACEPGKCANVAGKASAALALASTLWGDADQPYYDAELAAAYLTASKQLYEYGKARPGAQPSNPPDSYTEESWADDLALAAVELYRATGDAAYLEEAHDYLEQAGGFTGLDWGNMHALAHYELARLDPSFKDVAIEKLAASMESGKASSETNVFHVGIDQFHWGSAETMANVALVGFWYQDLSGDSAYYDIAQTQRDYILGTNPWGVCWVNGAGTIYPHNPHHQVASLTGEELRGFWDEGAVPLSTFENDGPEELLEADEYWEFQTEDAVYHDDTEDWVTNEPTITMNAAGLALTSWFVAMGQQ